MTYALEREALSNNRMKLTSGDVSVGCARRWPGCGARGVIESPLAAYPGVLRTHDVTNADVPARSLFGRKGQLAGWLCVLGITLVIVDLVALLPSLPDHWWQPERPPTVVGTGMQFDLRVMAVDFGFGWIGQWGYLGAFVWLSTAVIRAIKGRRHGRIPTASERILFLTLCVLLLTTSALVHLTPLRYPTYNIFVL